MSRPTNIAELPVELLLSIFSLLPGRDLASMRQTCRHINPLAAPVLFKFLYLKLGSEKTCDLLTSTSANPNIAPYVVDLRIVGPWELVGRHVSKAERTALGHLESFVRKLTNLRGVILEFDPRYFKNMKLPTQGLVFALADNPSIKEIDFHIHKQRRPLVVEHDFLPGLSKFKNLSSLHVRYRNVGNDYLEFESGVVQAVAASPMLKSFGFSIYDYKISASAEKLMHDVLRIYKEQQFTIPLQVLKLEGVPMLATVVIRRVLQNLKHLTLAHGSSAWDRKTLNGIAWEEIWEALYDAGCNDGLWLEILDTEADQPPPGVNALLKYLVAHPGLKGLSIRDPPDYSLPEELDGNDDAIEENGLDFDEDHPELLNIDHSTLFAGIKQKQYQNWSWATKFWSEVIPKSAHSLRELKLRHTEGSRSPWSYGPKVSDALRQCTSLRKLELCVSNANRDWAHVKGWNLDMLPTAPDSIILRDDWWIYINEPREQDERVDWDKSACPRRLMPGAWGLWFNCVVLLASDLGNMRFLEDVTITLGDPGCRPCRDRCIPLLDSWGPLARERLALWVPWKGYPHKLCGEDGIFGSIRPASIWL